MKDRFFETGKVSGNSFFKDLVLFIAIFSFCLFIPAFLKGVF